ncbi:MAG TPA: glucose 1-dehydrogenase [Acidobacteriaceae bacterium]|nr:glucose 1-dehydrogenase [Acidobacteriaceae bacterium]
MKLKDRISIVTGAGSGIGRAIAVAFGEEGSQVVLVDLDAGKAEAAAKAILSKGGNARSFRADVADPSSVASLQAFVRKELGPADILVNNAAIQVNKTIEDTSPEEWNRQMAVNVGGVFLCSRAFLPDLRQTRGVILNMSSVNGFFVEPFCAGYCATKGAILAFTKAIAIDHGREGIRVHAICPGYINAGLAEGYFESQPDPAKARLEAGSLHALGRIGQPEEVARAAVFLASADASFMTGSPLIVDGGFSAGLPPK